MNTQPYEQWIADNVKGDGYGRCKQVCDAMLLAFPELELRKGVYFSLQWGERQHWWLRHRETHDIVDPTGRQHPGGVLFAAPDSPAYDDLTNATDDQLADRLPSGRCPNCGDDVYRGGVSGGLCSAACADSYAAYLTAELRRGW